MFGSGINFEDAQGAGLAGKYALRPITGQFGARERWTIVPDVQASLNKVTVLCQRRGARCARGGKNGGIIRIAETELTNRPRIGSEPTLKLRGHHRRQLRIEPDRERRLSHRDELGRKHWMIQASTCEPEAGDDILGFQIWQFRHDLRRRHPGRQEIEDIDDANTQTADTGASVALVRIDCDSLHQPDGVAHRVLSCSVVRTRLVATT